MSNATQEMRWRRIRYGNPSLEQIDEIDKATTWDEVEPKWWLEMMGVRRRLLAKKTSETTGD